MRVREKVALNTFTIICWSAINLSVENIALRLAALALVAMALCNIIAALTDPKS